MLQKLFNSEWLKTTRVLVVDVVYSASGEYKLIPLLVQWKKDSIEWKEQSDSSFDSIDALKKKLKTNTPVVLSLSGKGVISRVYSEELEGEEGVLRVMPNINLADFYWNVTNTETQTFVGITRKNLVENILDDFIKSGFRVLDIFAGPVTINTSLLDREYDTVQLSAYKLTFEGENCLGVESTEHCENSNYGVGEKVISSSLINALFVGIQYLSESLNREISDDYCGEVVKEEGLKQLFDKAVIVMVLFYFVVLLGNFFIKDYYSVQFSELSSSMQFYLQKKATLDKLRGDLEYKKTLLFSSGIMEGNNITLYSDQIGKSVPSGVALTRMAIAPVKGGKRKKKEKLSYDKNSIVLEGATRNSKDFNQWVSTLKEYEWQDDIRITAYDRNPKSGWSDFRIEIDLEK